MILVEKQNLSFVDVLELCSLKRNCSNSSPAISPQDFPTMFKRVKRSNSGSECSGSSSSDLHHQSSTSLDELSRFERLEKIGEGTYGVVYKAKDTENSNRLVALKRIRLES